MMRRLQSIADQTLLPGEVVAVDPNVPRGCPRVAYDISGYDSVGNPLAPKKNGMRMRQTSLPIVFRSGLKAANADGVSVEAILIISKVSSILPTPPLLRQKPPR
jgi:hypothetical protein